MEKQKNIGDTGYTISRVFDKKVTAELLIEKRLLDENIQFVPLKSAPKLCYNNSGNSNETV